MNKRAQVTLESGLFIIIVAVSFVAMAGYLKRAIQGNWRANADSFSDGQFEFGLSDQVDSPDRYSAPKMTPIINNIAGPAYHLAAYDDSSLLDSRIIKVTGWGIYDNTAEHEE